MNSLRKRTLSILMILAASTSLKSARLQSDSDCTLENLHGTGPAQKCGTGTLTVNSSDHTGGFGICDGTVFANSLGVNPIVAFQTSTSSSAAPMFGCSSNVADLAVLDTSCATGTLSNGMTVEIAQGANPVTLMGSAFTFKTGTVFVDGNGADVTLGDDPWVAQQAVFATSTVMGLLNASADCNADYLEIFCNNRNYISSLIAGANPDILQAYSNLMGAAGGFKKGSFNCEEVELIFTAFNRALNNTSQVDAAGNPVTNLLNQLVTANKTAVGNAVTAAKCAFQAYLANSDELNGGCGDIGSASGIVSPFGSHTDGEGLVCDTANTIVGLLLNGFTVDFISDIVLKEAFHLNFDRVDNASDARIASLSLELGNFREVVAAANIQLAVASEAGSIASIAASNATYDVAEYLFNSMNNQQCGTIGKIGTAATGYIVTNNGSQQSEDCCVYYDCINNASTIVNQLVSGQSVRAVIQSMSCSQYGAPAIQGATLIAAMHLGQDLRSIVETNQCTGLAALGAIPDNMYVQNFLYSGLALRNCGQIANIVSFPFDPSFIKTGCAGNSQNQPDAAMQLFAAVKSAQYFCRRNQLANTLNGTSSTSDAFIDFFDSVADTVNQASKTSSKTPSANAALLEAIETVASAQANQIMSTPQGLAQSAANALALATQVVCNDLIAVENQLAQLPSTAPMANLALRIQISGGQAATDNAVLKANAALLRANASAHQASVSAATANSTPNFNTANKAAQAALSAELDAVRLFLSLSDLPALLPDQWLGLNSNGNCGGSSLNKSSVSSSFVTTLGSMLLAYLDPAISPSARAYADAVNAANTSLASALVAAQSESAASGTYSISAVEAAVTAAGSLKANAGLLSGVVNSITTNQANTAIQQAKLAADQAQRSTYLQDAIIAADAAIAALASANCTAATLIGYTALLQSLDSAVLASMISDSSGILNEVGSFGYGLGSLIGSFTSGSGSSYGNSQSTLELLKGLVVGGGFPAVDLVSSFRVTTTSAISVVSAFQKAALEAIANVAALAQSTPTSAIPQGYVSGLTALVGVPTPGQPNILNSLNVNSSATVSAQSGTTLEIKTLGGYLMPTTFGDANNNGIVQVDAISLNNLNAPVPQSVATATGYVQVTSSPSIGESVVAAGTLAFGAGVGDVPTPGSLGSFGFTVQKGAVIDYSSRTTTTVGNGTIPGTSTLESIPVSLDDGATIKLPQGSFGTINLSCGCEASPLMSISGKGSCNNGGYGGGREKKVQIQTN